MRISAIPHLIACAILISTPAAGLAAAEGGKSPSEFMPEGALGYAEISDLGTVISGIKNSELKEKITSHESFEKFMKSDPGMKFLGGKMMLEGMLGMDLWEASEKIFGGRMAAALYPQAGSKEPAILVVLQPDDEDALVKPKMMLKSFFSKVDTIDGAEVFTPRMKGKSPFFVVSGDTWIAASNKRDLIDSSISLYAGKSREGALSASKNLGKMRAEMGAEHLVQVFVDSEMISEFTGGRMGIPAKFDQPMISLVVGGMLELAAKSPYAGITVDYTEGEIALTAGVSALPESLGKAHQSAFAAQGEGVPQAPGGDEIIGSIAIHRDLSAWYNSRDALMSAESLPGFDKFESGIGAVLPGYDFGQDILPMFGKNVQFVASTQTYASLEGSKPGVQLPGFALIFDLDEPEMASNILQLTFQTIVAISNFDGAQKGRIPSLMEADIHNGVKLSTSRTLLKPEGKTVDIAYNFQPSAARVDNRFILSSSRELCVSLIDALKEPSSSNSTGMDAALTFQVAPFVELVKANRENIIANEIEKGKGVEQAKAEIDGVITLLGFLDSVQLDTGRGTGDGYRVRLAAKLN